MSQLLNAPPGLLFINKSSFHPSRTSTLTYQKCYAVHSSIQGGSHGIDRLKNSFEYKARSCEEVESDTFPDIVYDEVQSEVFPHVQTLRKFPKEELHAKFVLVRFDSSILLQALVDQSARVVSNTLFTIKYLLDAKAKVILVTSWTNKFHQERLGAESLAGTLSSVLQHNVATVQCIDCDMSLKTEELQKSDIILLDNLSEFKEEVSNCPKFAELLSAGVDIYVNEAFSESHKMLASTVGVTRFCSACMAGYHFEKSLCQLKLALKRNQRPHVTIVGGGNLYDKAAAIHFLASRSDALVFVGMMSFQIMHALGLPVLPNLVESGAHEAALDIIHLAHNRNIPILYPKDFWCTNNPFENHLKLFPAHGVMNGWLPIDLGPSSLEEIESLLAKCKKIMWIGPVKFKSSSRQTNGAIKLAQMIYKQCQRQCDVSVTIIGNMACKEMRVDSTSASVLNLIDNASVIWDFLKGRKLPGVMALDIAYPFEIDWRSAFRDPAQPLVVDIGSGNGLFILEMAKKRKHLNFLGLEINEKLVRRCLESVHQSTIQNGYFIATNATSTFRSLVSSYPGELVLVSIQCPDPDFNKPEHRRRMLQQSLVEAVADLLTHDGKVFLQSDIETVALRMKDQFLKYGKGKLSVVCDYHDAKINRRIWLEENPFEVRSDWEQHVIDRGGPMYRLMLSKTNNVE